MRYDTVVVGAGVAGLTAAVRLAEAGQRVVVLAKGVGSSGTGRGLTDGSCVNATCRTTGAAGGKGVGR